MKKGSNIFFADLLSFTPIQVGPSRRTDE